MANDVLKKMTELHGEIDKMNDFYVTLWKEDMFLTWRWWLNVGILILPWVFWFIFRKKESTNRLLLAGLFVFLITSVFDSIGVAFGQWVYLYTPLPYLHTFFLPWDFSSFPVMIMFLLQFKPEMNPYLKALFFAVISAFVFEPIFVYLKVYALLKWKYYYGLPIYFLIYLLAHRVSRRDHFERLD